MNSTDITKHYKSSQRRNSTASTHGKQSESSPIGNWVNSEYCNGISIPLPMCHDLIHGSEKPLGAYIVDDPPPRL